ncbi:hypothetical protein F0562_022562 [Nyssa sinensis]|uniref:Uncharacterized protein n=1 Tax=Nyssa sinensis TaxID=561372 RepID=A0A5J5BP08_9ASTE|nr:hypothetical protein F0562_022562 [Nyssa sinensis]
MVVAAIEAAIAPPATAVAVQQCSGGASDVEPLLHLMFLEVKVCRVDSFEVERTALELRYSCLDNAHGSSSCCNGDKEVGSQSATERELPVFYRDDRDGVSSTKGHI